MLSKITIILTTFVNNNDNVNVNNMVYYLFIYLFIYFKKAIYTAVKLQ